EPSGTSRSRPRSARGAYRSASPRGAGRRRGFPSKEKAPPVKRCRSLYHPPRRRPAPARGGGRTTSPTHRLPQGGVVRAARTRGSGGFLLPAARVAQVAAEEVRVDAAHEVAQGRQRVVVGIDRRLAVAARVVVVQRRLAQQVR